MKRFALAICTLLAAACTQVPQDKGFTIKGEVTGLDCGKVLFYDRKGEAMDSLAFTGGKFVFKGQVESPQEGFFCLKDTLGESALFTRFFMDNVPMEFQADASGKKTEYAFTGAPMNDLYNDYLGLVRSMEELRLVSDLNGPKFKALMDKDRGAFEKIQKQETELLKKAIDKFMAFRPGADRSAPAATILCDLVRGKSLEAQLYAESRFAEDFTGCRELEEMREYLAGEKRIAIGRPVPEFRVKDLQGKEYTPDSFKGGWVYLDFSASWCVACKGEIPYIREAAKALKGGKIAFVTINLDEQREKWQQEVEKENITWLCLSDGEGFRSELARRFNISQIPAIFILDPDGKIVLKDVRQEDLLPALENLLGK